MRVDLDVYSGRPNPTWETTAEEADQLAQALRQLPEREGPEFPGSLGYRGVVLQGPAVRALGYERITALSSRVLAEGPGVRKVFTDRDRRFEWLAVATAEGRADLREFVKMLPPSPTPTPRPPPDFTNDRFGR
jgi:hypothetical protein